MTSHFGSHRRDLFTLNVLHTGQKNSYYSGNLESVRICDVQHSSKMLFTGIIFHRSMERFSVLTVVKKNNVLVTFVATLHCFAQW